MESAAFFNTGAVAAGAVFFNGGFDVGAPGLETAFAGVAAVGFTAGLATGFV